MPQKKKIRLNGVVTAYFRFRGIDLLQAREAAGLSEQKLADRVEFWGQRNISKLESSNPHELHTITLQERRLIEKALNK